VLTSPSTLAVSGLSFSYPGQAVFLDFAWQTSSRLNLLLGPSGCGKTTLLKLLAGQLLPTSKAVIEPPGPYGLILQDDALFPWLSVDQNLDLMPRRLRRQESSLLLQELVDIVSPLKHKLVAQLSFGQRRTVEILRILSGNFSSIFLDEPLNFLDSEKRWASIRCFKALAQQGVTFVMSTHYDSDFDKEFQRFHFSRDLPHQHCHYP